MLWIYLIFRCCHINVFLMILIRCYYKSSHYPGIIIKIKSILNCWKGMDQFWQRRPNSSRWGEIWTLWCRNGFRCHWTHSWAQWFTWLYEDFKVHTVYHLNSQAWADEQKGTSKWGFSCSRVDFPGDSTLSSVSRFWNSILSWWSAKPNNTSACC